jgi:hypothetical protein
MKERMLMGVGKGDLSLTNQKVVLKKEPIVKYNDDTKEIPLNKVSAVEVKEMDFSASFVFNWMGIEMGLLLIFFGLTSASLPLYNVYLTVMGSSNPNLVVQVGRLILALIMIWLGFMLIPWFDGVIIRVKSKDGKTIRYLKNIRFRPELEKFKFKLIQEVQKSSRKK